MVAEIAFGDEEAVGFNWCFGSLMTRGAATDDVLVLGLELLQASHPFAFLSLDWLMVRKFSCCDENVTIGV